MFASRLDRRIQETLHSMGVSDDAQAWELLSRLTESGIPSQLQAPLVAIGLEAALAQLEADLPPSAMRRENDPVANVLRHGLSVPSRKKP